MGNSLSIKTKKDYIKHLIECNCILPQFKETNPPVFHKFIVFSVINESEEINKKNVKCTNCGLIHKIYDIGKSTILPGGDNITSIIDEDEIKISLPQNLVKVVEKYNPQLHTWEEIEFTLNEKLWGKEIILSSNEIKGKKNGKILTINGENQFKIRPFEEDMILK